MPPERPPILNFDGLTESAAIQVAKQAFRSICVPGPTIDALGHEVIVDNARWHHVCFKQDEGDQDPKAPRDQWRPDRASYIPWIPAILTSPWELRPNKVAGRLSYLLQYSADPKAGHPAEIMYLAVTEQTSDPGKVLLVTAYPVIKRAYWNEARKVGACLYPHEKTKAARKGGK